MTTPLAYDAAARQWSGSADFRSMPTDDFSGGRSTLTVADAARGRAVQLAYTWLHPTDGEQTGTLLLGVPADEGSVTAAWVDSWHQRDLAMLTGQIDDRGYVTIGYEYAPGWQWEIEVRITDALVEMVMRNSVPGQDGSPASTYDVMLAAWAQ